MRDASALPVPGAKFLMNLLARAYGGLIRAMAVGAALLMVAVMITVCMDVLIRNLGRQPSAHFFTLSEYALLLIPCLGAPWLVREKGHVYIEILLMHLRPAYRRHLSLVIGLACIAICLTLAWFGLQVTVQDWEQANKDVRSFDAPRWAIVMWVPLSFLLMATEFARFLLRGESFLASMAGETAAPSTPSASAR
jgi:TRAP-type C4-dicarboxylate transport system permease small subunit